MKRLGLRLKFIRRSTVPWSDEEMKLVAHGLEKQLTSAQIQALLPDRPHRMIDRKITRIKEGQGIRTRAGRKWTDDEIEQLKHACTLIVFPPGPMPYTRRADLATIENIASEMGRTHRSIQYKLYQIRKRPELVQNSDMGITSTNSSLSKRAFSSQAKRFAHKEGGILVQEAQTTDPKDEAFARSQSKWTPERVNQLIEMRKQRLPFAEIANSLHVSVMACRMQWERAKKADPTIKAATRVQHIWTQEKVDQLIEMRKQRMPFVEICRFLAYVCRRLQGQADSRAAKGSDCRSCNQGTASMDPKRYSARNTAI